MESRQPREPVVPNQYHLSRDISALFASILRDGVDNSRHLPLESML